MKEVDDLSAAEKLVRDGDADAALVRGDDSPPWTCERMSRARESAALTTAVSGRIRMRRSWILTARGRVGSSAL